MKVKYTIELDELAQQKVQEVADSVNTCPAMVVHGIFLRGAYEFKIDHSDLMGVSVTR